jgi:alpha-N-arabinofuranosidase
LAFDEWNIWYREKHLAHQVVEEVYNYTDALTAASLIHVILRNADSIKMANISELANVLGVLRTDRDRCVRQTIYYPHVLLSRKHAGRVVETVADGPAFSAKHERFFCGIVDPERARDESLPSLIHFSAVPALDVLVSIDDAAKRMTVSVINKSERESLDTRLTFNGISPSGQTMILHRLTGGNDLLAENTLERPDRVGLMTQVLPLADTITFPPASLTLIEFTI